MKLATVDDGTPAGMPVVVSQDLTRFAPATSIVGSLREALDRWDRIFERLWGLAARLEAGRQEAWRFQESQALAPLPVAAKPDGEAVTLRRARSSIPVAPQVRLVRTRFEAQALAGRDGRSRLVVLTLILDGAGSCDDPSLVILCSPVVFTLSSLDEAVEPDRPLVSRLWRVRDGETEESFRRVAEARGLPKAVSKGLGPRLVPISGFDNLGMTGLRGGDRLRAAVTDCRRLPIMGTIEAKLDIVDPQTAH